LQQLAQLPADDRRALLKSIPDEQYADIIKVLGNMPYVDFQVRCEGESRLLQNLPISKIAHF
jgi:translocation protein SEC63